MKQTSLNSFAILGLALGVLLALSGSAIAEKGGIPGPPSGGETANNLSLPAVLTGSAIIVPHNWNPPAAPELGVHYSYGCDQPEGDGQFNYPNTSCVDSLTDPTEYYTADECTDDVQPSPCQGLPVSRIYWQKVDANEWWADGEGAITTTPGDPSRSVAYVDWGDALEAVSWNERSVIRVETQPYSTTIDGYLPWETSCYDAAMFAGLDPEVVCKVGLQMWHVSGQGITEHWGVRANDVDEFNDSYNYDSPFQIIHTSAARLNLTKMAAGDALCAEPGGNPGDDPPAVGDWDPINAEWGQTCTYSDAPYTVELSVGGKYVYGFNWRMLEVELDSLCGSEWLKTGFWRLTFYAPDDVIFDDAEAPNVAPPAVPSEERPLPRDGIFNTVLADPPPEPLPDGEDEDPTADDRLYRPVVDVENNLTYLDICIVAKTQGGGGGGGGKP